VICPSCREENPERFRLCGFCGAELPRAAAHEARKIVTLVFADVTGSTALGERLDPESVRWVMSRFFETAREVLERHGGTVEKFIGDAVMSAFGIPHVREDDALRGVRAAAELRDRLRELGRDVEARYGAGIAVRIGVNTGEVVAGDAAAGQAFASGDAVNVAARLEQAAAPGEVLLGEATLRLVRDAVTVEAVEPLALKGKAQPVPAWRLVDVLVGVAGVRRNLHAPLIGREGELAQLLELWRRAREERDVRVATVVAPAGTGKTRLISELAEHVQPEAQVLTGHCLPYGEGITFAPIAEAVRQAAGLAGSASHEIASGEVAALLEDDADAAEIVERIGPALGFPGPPIPVEETFWAIRKLFEALSRRRPVLAVVDDVHWAEETLLDLIEYLGAWTRRVPLLLICTARPELIERRPSLISPRANASALLLQPLGVQAADELMAWQLGAAPLAGALRERILATSEGNPLFVQELVRMLIDDGLIVRSNGSWQATAELGELAMPPTIQALLAARLDQLEPSEREVAQRAAIAGPLFSWGAVRELCRDSVPGLSSSLHALVRKEVIVPAAGPPGSGDAFRFAHILVRDAAYAGLAKRTRAELHERYAHWVEQSSLGSAGEQEDILGFHLEQAAAFTRELGDASDADRIGAQASAHLASAGRRALAAGDLPAASNLLGRAADNLPAGDPQRLAIRLQSIPALFETGRLAEADAQVAEILDVATSPELVTAGRAWRGYFDAQTGIAACEATAAAWLDVSERAGDHAGQAAALGILAKMKFWSGSAAAADAIWQRAADQAALAGDVREEAESLVWLLISTMYGPTAVTAALERCDAIARRLGGSLKVGAVAAIERGVLEAMQGDCEGGRERVALGRSRLDELGLTMLANVMAQEAAIVEQLAGDAQAAEAVLRLSFERLELMGEAGFKMTVAAMLARSLFEQERVEDARHFADIATRGLDDTDPTGLGCAVKALAAAYDGDTAAAVVLAEEAVALSSATDFLRDHGDRRLDLARVLQLAGRHDEARAALAQADLLYERKGCIAALKTTAARRAELSA
jgi:class 3 adenylate cyclase/tetratricopeptide (TPR) repeat protein